MKKRLIFVQINGQDLKEIKKEFKSMHLGKRSKRGEKKERWGRIGETNVFIFLSRPGRDRQRRLTDPLVSTPLWGTFISRRGRELD